jgi:hypothetical protein
MSYADTARKATAKATTVGSLNVTLNSTIAGNLVICGTSSYDGGGFSQEPVVTDGGNTWTKRFTQTGVTVSQCASLSYSVLGTGGNRTINSDPGVNTYDIALFVHEFSGPHSTPASGTPVGAGNSGSALASTGSTIPTDNDVLVIAVEACTNPLSSITENAGSEGFTLSNENENAITGDAGSMVFKIMVGSPGTPSHSWTLGQSTTWECGIAAFKPLSETTHVLTPAMMV